MEERMGKRKEKIEGRLEKENWLFKISSLTVSFNFMFLYSARLQRVRDFTAL